MSGPWKFESGWLSTDFAKLFYTQLSTNALFLKLDASNDPVTGHLTITPTSGTKGLTVNKDVYIKAGQKLYFDA